MALKNAPAKAESPQAALQEGFKKDLQSITPYLETLLPYKGGVQRFSKMTQLAVLRNPGLLSANKVSLLLALLWCAEKDMEPGVEDGVWLIPFKNKNNDLIVTPVPAYKGLIAKCVQVGAATAVDAWGVYEGDEFFYCYGLEPDLKHEPPKLGDERGELVGCYAIVTLPNGEKKFRVMDRPAVERIRNMSKAWQSHPETGVWKEHEESMFLKTVIKQVLKTVPMKAELRDLLADDGKLEAGESVGALLREAGHELPQELQEGPEGMNNATGTTATAGQAQEEKLDTSAFDDLVAKELEGLPEPEAVARLTHLKENLKITAKNMKKSIPAFKIYAAPYFHPYMNDKQQQMPGFWAAFLDWEIKNYPPAAATAETAGPGAEEAGPETVGAAEGAAAASEKAFADRKKDLTMKVLAKIIPWTDLEIASQDDIKPENIDDLEKKVEAWKKKK